MPDLPTTLKLCLDVHYQAEQATVAGVTFQDWADALPHSEFALQMPAAASYQPGEFYKRELPCLLAALQHLPQPPAVVIVDGYVWLGDDHPGLGARLFEATAGAFAVIGVAKTHFRQANAVEVFRGDSKRPLYITAAGMPVAQAAEHITGMHGQYRLPTLLKRADQLCRGTL